MRFQILYCIASIRRGRGYLKNMAPYGVPMAAWYRAIVCCHTSTVKVALPSGSQGYLFCSLASLRSSLDAWHSCIEHHKSLCCNNTILLYKKRKSYKLQLTFTYYIQVATCWRSPRSVCWLKNKKHGIGEGVK